MRPILILVFFISFVFYSAFGTLGSWSFQCVCMQMMTFCFSNVSNIFNGSYIADLFHSFLLGDYIKLKIFFFVLCRQIQDTFIFQSSWTWIYSNFGSIWIYSFFSFCLLTKLTSFHSNYGIYPMEIPTQVKDKWERLVLCVLSFFYSWIHMENKIAEKCYFSLWFLFLFA